MEPSPEALGSRRPLRWSSLLKLGLLVGLIGCEPSLVEVEPESTEVVERPRVPVAAAGVIPGAGVDDDGVDDVVDNCPTTYNPEQDASACSQVRRVDYLVDTQGELNALAGVTDIDGRLVIRHESLPLDFSPLSSLVEVDELVISMATGSPLNGTLASLRRVEGNLSLNGVVSENLAEFPALEIVGQLVLNYSTVEDLSGLVQLRASPGLLVYNASVGAWTGLEGAGVEQLVVNFSAVSSLSGIGFAPAGVEYVELGRNPTLTDVSALEGIASDGLSLTLVGLPLTALPNLAGTNLSGLSFWDMPLVDLRGLEGARFISSAPNRPAVLSLSDLPSLSSLDGLPTATDESVFVSLSRLPSGVDYSSLGGLSRIGLGLSDMPSGVNLNSVTGDLFSLSLLRTNADVLSGLSIPDSLQYLQLNTVAGLTDLSQFDGLTKLESTLYITSNPDLVSLSGLEGLTSGGVVSGYRSVIVFDNPQLSNCSGILPLFLAIDAVDDQWNFDGTVGVWRNAPGCNSIEEILAAPPPLALGSRAPLATGPSQQYDADAHSRRVVYVDDASGSADVYLYDFDASTRTPIADGPADETDPSIHLDVVAYQSGSQIFVYDITSGTTTQIASNGRAPRVSGRRVVWEDLRLGGTSEAAYVFDFDTGLSEKVSPDGMRAIRPDIEGTRVVWWSPEGGNGNDIYLAEIGGGPPQKITDQPLSQDYPRISGGTVVWRDGRNGNWDIYAYDIASGVESQLTNSIHAEVMPSISWPRVAYYSNAGGEFNVFMHDLRDGSTEQLSFGSTSTGFPEVTGDLVAWVDDDAGDRDVEVYGLDPLPEPDRDGDGVPDWADVCLGFDDAADRDGDGVPDGCDPFTRGYWRFEGPTLGSSSLDPADLTSVGAVSSLTLGSGPGSSFPRIVAGVPNDQAVRLSGGRMNGVDLSLGQPFTVEAFVHFKTLTGRYGKVIAGFGDARNTPWSFQVRLDRALGNEPNELIIGGAIEYQSSWVANSGIVLAPAVDYYVAVSVDPAGDAVFRVQDLTNGGALQKAVVSHNITGPLPADSRFTIGDVFDGAFDFELDGLVDELRVVDRLLTDDELLIASAIFDQDGDGVPDGEDVCPGFDDTLDSDGDLVPDGCDAFPADPTETTDTDGDGVGDNADVNPDDPTGGTPTGSDVSVQPNDQNGDPVGTTLTFDQIEAPGETTVTTSTTGAPPPSAFRLGNPPVYYDVETTASFTGNIEVCFDYSGQSFNNENNLKLLHDDGTGWADVTTSLDTTNDIICGTTSSLSPFTVTELNVAPVVTTVSLPADPIAVGGTVDFAALFTDANTGDTHTGAFDWGAGPVDGQVTETNGSGTLSLVRTFTDPGVFSVEVIVTDGDLEGRRSSLLDEPGYVVVFDPSGSFVTGGGWIDSPAGACTWGACTAQTTGKANFGFVSKYRRGANTPTGETQFRFKAGDVDFKSTFYEWLVVAGARAQFKGTGQIGGTGDYGFMVTAIDGEVNGGGGVDRFRIKIWDVATGDVVYDNQRGQDDTSNAATELGGGSVRIHN